jgi:hypoxanthine phosphoribosyltransferase
MRKNSTAMLNDIAAVLHHETTILSRLDAMAREIMADYEGKPLTVVAIMNGGLILLADLLRRVQLPLKIETISVASYHGGTASSGTVTFLQTGVPDLRGRHVILLDDILDSGRTLEAVRAKLLAESCPESLRICVLLQKRCERACAIEPDYVGFEIGDEFVVGYGLDYQGKYRNLPFIGVLRPEAIGEEA